MSFEYSKLTKSQKRIVDGFVRLRPELATATTITRPEVEVLFKMLFDERGNGGEKMGYPTWMTKNARVGRGVYAFPGPNASAPAKPVIAKINVSAKAQARADEEFMAELQEAGVTL